MPGSEFDPALFVTSRSRVQAPAEEHACVICTNPAHDDQSRIVYIVDVNPTSRTYSEVIGEVALDQHPTRFSSLSSKQNLRSDAGPIACPGDPDPGRHVAPKAILVHDPSRPVGFVSTGFSLHNLSSEVSAWCSDDDQSGPGQWALHKVIDIPAEPACPWELPPLLRLAGGVPPLITDIALSPDGRFLYVACWGTGDLKQFDVTDPRFPHEVASVRIGGVTARAAHPSQARRLNGGPGTVTVSSDGRRIYLTNSLSRTWEAQLYPDGLRGWMVKLDADPCGGLSFDPNFFLDFGDQRPGHVFLPGQGARCG